MKIQTQKVLLVDEDRSIRESLNKILRAQKYQVALAQTGPEAIEKHGRERIELLLLDLAVKDDSASLHWLADINPLLPIVIITGRSNPGVLAEQAGAEALMEKPLDVPLLLQTICALIAQPMENRLLRARQRVSGLRSGPYDNPLLGQMLLSRWAVITLDPGSGSK